MRTRSQSRQRRPRRGATIVFVAVVSVVLVGMVAFAIDVSRIAVGANELQTDADAAALAGARQLQTSPSANPVVKTKAFGDSSNRAYLDSVSFDTQDVEPIWWDPASVSTPATVKATWSEANAVRVTSRETSPLLFGALLRSTEGATVRSAIAWIANVNGVKCTFKPFGFPIQNLFEDIGLPGVNNRSLTQAEVAKIDSMLKTISGKVALTQVLYPKDQGITPTNETSIYWPLADNMNQYPDQISANAGCGANSEVITGQNETSAFPGNGGGSNGKKAVDGSLGSPPASGDAICRRVPDDATCYDPVTGEAGITITAAYTGGGTNLASCSTTCSLPVRMVAGFRIVCIFYGKVVGNGPNGQINNSERCPWLRDNFPSSYNKAYEVGTLVGYPVTSPPGLGSNVQLGNTPSLAQRLILVR